MLAGISLCINLDLTISVCSVIQHIFGFFVNSALDISGFKQKINVVLVHEIASE